MYFTEVFTTFFKVTGRINSRNAVKNFVLLKANDCQKVIVRTKSSIYQKMQSSSVLKIGANMKEIIFRSTCYLCYQKVHEA